MNYVTPEAVDLGSAEMLSVKTPSSLASKAFRTVDSWRQRSRNRALLAGTSSHNLQDIGISKIDALIELNKPFWEE